jgi:hypothetical protein
VTLTPGTHRSGITGLGGGVPEEPIGHRPKVSTPPTGVWGRGSLFAAFSPNTIHTLWRPSRRVGW